MSRLPRNFVLSARHPFPRFGRGRMIPAAVSILIAAVTTAGARGEGNRERDVEIFGPPAPSPPEVMARDEQGRITVRATRIDEPLVLDGRLDDPVYQRVAPLADFIQQNPHEGEPASEKTEAWIFFDDRNLYVAARCWDSHPERMVFNEMRRDHGDVNRNENFVVAIDTFYDRRNGFFFQTNPLGAIRDQASTDEGNGRNADWNTVWNAKASVFEGGWMLEMAIPFKSLRYHDRREQVWGINMRRVVRWKNEMSYLAPVSAAFGGRGIHRFSDAATLVGIEAPAASRNLELKPYALSSLTTNRTVENPFSNDLGGDAGFDVKYGVTRGLIADFTYNTDFAQIEEDQQEVNLTRFSLFFPEKRDFFLEGQGIFAFGGVESVSRGGSARPGGNTTDLTPILFFSRRIGLTAEGVDPIRGGGRLTGRAGAYRVGALSIRTGGLPEAGRSPTTFSVFRLRRDVLRRSDVGIIATHRTTSLSETASSNLVFGLDGNFALQQYLKLNAFYAVSRTPRATGGLAGEDTSSYLGKLDYSSDRYELVLEHLKVGEDFEPELGFLKREAFRRHFARGRFSPRPRSIESIRRFVFRSEMDYITDLDARVETRRLQGTFEIEFESSDQAQFEYTRNFEFLPEPFEIATGIVLPVEEYRFQDVRWEYRLGAQRLVPSTIGFKTGSFFNGRRREASYEGRVEISPKLSVEPRVSLNWVDLPQGSFAPRLLSARTNFTFTPRMFVSSFLQYNTASDSLSASVRLRWEYEPGSDFFVVYSEGREDFSATRFLANRTLAVKFTKLFRF